MASGLAQDGIVIVTALAAPGQGFARAVARRRALSVVVLSTALSLLATGLVLPAIDSEAVAGEALQAEMTAHERTQAIETASKLYRVTAWAQAGLGPGLWAFLIAVGLYFAFWVAGARTPFKATFTVAAHALVPQALRALLTVPAALLRAPVAPSELGALLPSSLAAALPAGHALPVGAVAAASALELFTLWSLLLLGAGMHRASGASRLRSWAVLLALFAAYVAIFKVVPAAGGLGSTGGP